MPVVTLLSWNVEHFGPSKTQDVRKGTTNKSGTGLFSLIAWTAYYQKANIISLLEVSKSTYQIVANLMIGFLQSTSAALGTPERWGAVHTNSNKGDIYVVLYKMGQGFEPIFSDSLNAQGEWIKTPVSGTTKFDVNGKDLKFQGSKTISGGRMPGFFAFSTIGLPTNIAFTIIPFHGMYNTQPANAIGLKSITKIFPTDFVWQTVKGQTEPKKIPISFSLMAGDYNVDILTYEEDYKQAVSSLPGGLAAIGASQKEYARSTIGNTTPPGGYPKTVDYRVNAYDNILVKPTPTSKVASNAVIDMLQLIQAGNALAGPVAILSTELIKFGEELNSIPPKDNEDAWHVYRKAVSNHLPVTASFLI